VHVLRADCQWKALPKERFDSASAVHKRSWSGNVPASSSRCGGGASRVRGMALRLAWQER